MNDSRFSELIRGWLDDSLSPGEVSELLALLRGKGDLSELETHLDRALASMAFAGNNEAATADEIYDRVLQTIRAGDRRHQTLRWLRPLAAAAVIILMVGAGYWLIHPNPPKNTGHADVVKNDIAPGHNGAILTLSGGTQLVLDSAANGRVATQGAVAVVKQNGQLSYTKVSDEKAIIYNTLSTPRGRQYRLLLPDGTTVWLNAASSIKYPVFFSGKDREVEVTGEAYFEVFENASKPFKVKINGKAEVEVLGTHFNINAYDDEPLIKTTLLEGSVRFFNLAVTASSDGQPGAEPSVQSVMLRPGEQAQLLVDQKLVGENTNKASGDPTVSRNVDLVEVMAWKNGRFEFQGTEIQEIMRQVSRWYDVDVVYQGKPKEQHFRGGISRAVDAAQVFRMLEMTEAVHFKIDGKKVIVMP